MARRPKRDPDTIDFDFYLKIVPGKRPKQLRFPLEPIWTKNKAKLIEKYLSQFVQVTHHGTYIDGFAGPQQPNEPDMWAAKLVLDITPRLLRRFYLFDKDKGKVALLNQLKDTQPLPDKSKRERKRLITIKRGDANRLIRDILDRGEIPQGEATFCLLDQRNIECEWATLKALSTYKKRGHKIEFLYFLPSAWLNRSFTNRTRNKAAIRNWWGREDWMRIVEMPSLNRVEEFKERFRKELGYSSAEAWPIYQNDSKTYIMYYMIHATDHPAAPSLMGRAYRKALAPPEDEQVEQLEISRILKAAGTGKRTTTIRSL